MSAPRGELRTDVSEIDDAAALRMARRFENAGDLASALNMYRRAIQMSPDNTVALLGVARIYERAGAREDASRYYRRILQLEPANSRAAASVAEAHIFGGEAAQAITFLDQFLISAPGTAVLFNLLGIAHDLEGNQGDAQLAYAEGLNIAPNDSAITSNLALSFAVREDYQTAIALVERVLNDSANSSEEDRSIARQNLALIYALSGQLEAAEEIARTVLSAEEVATNRVFYARLSQLSNSQKAQAVFLGSLASLDDTEEAMDIPEWSPGGEASGRPMTEEEKDIAAANIVRGTGAEDMPVRQADDRTAPELAAEAAVSDGGLAIQSAGPDEYPPYWVQLGSYRSPQRAKNGWKTLSTRFPNLLAGYVGYRQTFESEQRGRFFRLLVQASETFSAANLVCGTFKIEGMDCLVIKTGGQIEPLPDDRAKGGLD